MPSTSAKAVPSVTVPSFRVTVDPGSAVPASVGRSLPVVKPLTGEVMATLAVVSMVTARRLEAADVFPAGSVAVVVMLRAPAVRAVVTAKVQAPAPLALTVPSRVAPS